MQYIKNIMQNESSQKLWGVVILSLLGVYEILIIASLFFFFLIMYCRCAYSTKKNCPVCEHGSHSEPCKESHTEKIPLYSYRKVEKSVPIKEYGEPYQIKVTKYKNETYWEYGHQDELTLDYVDEDYYEDKIEHWQEGPYLRTKVTPIKKTRKVCKQVTKPVYKQREKTRKVSYEDYETKRDERIVGYEKKMVDEQYVSSYKSNVKTCGCTYKNMCMGCEPLLVNLCCILCCSVPAFLFFGLLINMVISSGIFTSNHPVIIIVLSVTGFNILFPIVIGLVTITIIFYNYCF